MDGLLANDEDGLGRNGESPCGTMGLGSRTLGPLTQVTGIQRFAEASCPRALYDERHVSDTDVKLNLTELNDWWQLGTWRSVVTPLIGLE